MDDPQMELTDLVVRYPRASILEKRPRPAVRGVGLRLWKGQTLGIVGESGSGKSSLLKAILRLVPVESGRIRMEGDDWLALPARQMRRRRARIGVVAQNPFMSLSPRLGIDSILAEPMVACGRMSRRDIAARSRWLLERCGLSPGCLRQRAGDLSGGQAQRVAIARSLALEPSLLILDEPTSALDVSVQAQILNLLLDLREDLGLTMLMVTHDLDVVAHISDHLLVMRDGVAVEDGPTAQVLSMPTEPYTRDLIHGLRIGIGPRERAAAAAPNLFTLPGA